MPAVVIAGDARTGAGRLPQISEACYPQSRLDTGPWERLVPDVPLADLFEADTLSVNDDAQCSRDLGFPVTGHFYGEVSRSACC
jgi:hypothetical protein